MNDALTLPKALAKRLDAHAARLGQSPVALIKTLIKRELDQQRWLERELDKGDAEAMRGELVNNERVMDDARALLKKRARRREAA